MNRLRAFVFSLLLALAGGAALVPTASAVDILQPACKVASASTVCKEAKPTTDPFLTIIGVVVRLLAVVIGVASVIVIIASGFRLINSGGDAGKVATARGGIVYALVGIVVAVLAATLVGFILDNLG